MPHCSGFGLDRGGTRSHQRAGNPDRWATLSRRIISRHVRLLLRTHPIWGSCRERRVFGLSWVELGMVGWWLSVVGNPSSARCGGWASREPLQSIRCLDCDTHWRSKSDARTQSPRWRPVDPVRQQCEIYPARFLLNPTRLYIPARPVRANDRLDCRWGRSSGWADPVRSTRPGVVTVARSRSGVPAWCGRKARSPSRYCWV